MTFNKGWKIIGNFTLKFEYWNYELHGRINVVPSHGGWLRFHNIPLQNWCIETFKAIGDAYGGYIECVDKCLSLIGCMEAVIRVKGNYCGFIPIEIDLKQENGAVAVVQVVTFEDPKL